MFGKGLSLPFSNCTAESTLDSQEFKIIDVWEFTCLNPPVNYKMHYKGNKCGLLDQRRLACQTKQRFVRHQDSVLDTRVVREVKIY